jgi:hypothetical protein
MVPPVAVEDSSDSERTLSDSSEQISPGDAGLGDYFEADSRHRSAGDVVRPRVAVVTKFLWFSFFPIKITTS